MTADNPMDNNGIVPDSTGYMGSSSDLMGSGRISWTLHNGVNRRGQRIMGLLCKHNKT